MNLALYLFDLTWTAWLDIHLGHSESGAVAAPAAAALLGLW